LHVTDICSGTGKEFIPPEAMHRGKYVHLATHYLDTTTASPEAIERWWAALHQPWAGFVRAWARAKAELGIVVIASEEPMKDERRGYQGKRDKRVRMNGTAAHLMKRRGEGIVDLKCCASGNGVIPETTGLQIAGYVGDAKLWRAAIALHPDGSYRWHDDQNNKEIFRPGDWREFNARLVVVQADIQRGWREAPAPREE
jgi:hypothetical protein